MPETVLLSYSERVSLSTVYFNRPQAEKKITYENIHVHM